MNLLVGFSAHHHGSVTEISNASCTTRRASGIPDEGVRLISGLYFFIDSQQARTKDLDQIQLIDLDPKVLKISSAHSIHLNSHIESSCARSTTH